MNDLTIGDLARHAGVNVETIRYYERREILKKPPRRPSGYRVYDADTIRLGRFIKRAQELGFTLEEIKQLIELRGKSRRRRTEVLAVAQAKLRDIEQKIQDLQSMRRALAQLVSACACSHGLLECPIIDALNSEDRNC